MHVQGACVCREDLGSRSDVVKVAIVITDGRSTNPMLTKWQAQYARSHDIHLFAIGAYCVCASTIGAVSQQTYIQELGRIYHTALNGNCNLLR